MAQIGHVLMMDGGWGFSVASDSEPARRLWVAYENEARAATARAAIAETLEDAISLDVVGVLAQHEIADAPS